MFIELLEYLLDLFYDFTSSYGLAIILLSFLILLILSNKGFMCNLLRLCLIPI